MSALRDDEPPLLESILHPTDFSEGSYVAFLHALKAALLAKAELTLLHVAGSPEAEWQDFPGVRETLERWQLLPQGSPRSAVQSVGISVTKVMSEDSDPVGAVLHYLDQHPADLLVLAAHQKDGRAAWLQHSRAEPIAREAARMTLFIPGDSPGFVAAADGSASLCNVLIPVAATPDPQPALDAAARVVSRLGGAQGTFTLLHVGERGAMPALRAPEVAGWDVRKVTESGDVIQGILETAQKTRADLIVMTTDGRNGFLDALRGSHSERVLRQARTALLTVPGGSLAAELS